ncbi:hypothetical protein [Cellulophaga baltica]|uniref:hypothetical protein n=1 Tax=Cellulophaga baltica TaxID=76594 RepID=UPI0024941552|nr:hypothetical protein [Cellulophaga baltica]
MKKFKTTLILGLLSVMSCTSQNKSVAPQKVVTAQMVAAQEKLCLNPHKIEQIEEEIRAYLDTTSVQQIKERTEANYEYYLDHKTKIISEIAAFYEQEDTYFKNKIKSYKPNEESYTAKQNVSSALVNNNHIAFRDSIQQGLYFNQYLEDNKSSIRAVSRYNGATTFTEQFDNDSYRPHYPINFDSEEDLTIKQIFYHGGTHDTTALPVEAYAFPLNAISINTLKRIDSFELEIKLKYVAKIDTVHFSTEEIGVQKNGIKLLKMKDNYVEYELPSEYYPYHKGTLLEEIYYNKDGKVLETGNGLSNSFIETPEEDYNNRLNAIKDSYEYAFNTTTKEELFKVFKYLDLRFNNEDNASRQVNKQILKGNVASFTLYLENRRDTLVLLPTLKNSAPLRNIYVHELNDRTDFITKNGKIIKTFPSEITFMYNSETQNFSDKYFYIDLEDAIANEYYYLDQEKQMITKLPYANIDYLCPSIFIASEKDKDGFKLLSKEKNQLLSDQRFSNYSASPYTDDILVANDDGTFVLYDQDGQLITINTQKVTKVILKEATY